MSTSRKTYTAGVIAVAWVTSFAGCGILFPTPAQTEPFTLKFSAAYKGEIVGCGDVLDGFGTDEAAEIQISDLRFYISDLKFFDHDGEEIPIELDENDFQFASDDGTVALIDLTGTATGACAGEGLSFPEGTARSNEAISGTTLLSEVRSVSFSVGIPQQLMKATLADHIAEDAPSPLREMHWSWAFAYRFFVLNFTMVDDGVAGEGYVHVGSTDCGGDGTRALTDRDECGHLNTPRVVLSDFHPADDTVIIDLGELLKQLDFEVLADETTLVPGVACHSSADQSHCPAIFGNLGVDITTGNADPTTNAVFSKKR